MELTGKNYTRRDWRSLLATRRGTVFVAAACALVATGILVVAMNRYRQSVDTGGSRQTVLVASGLIQKGTSGEALARQELFKPTSLASKQVTAGAIADTSQLHGEVAAADIYPGQQIVAADFTGNGGLPTKLAPDQRAMTITVDSAHGMIGQIHNGDHVDVYAGVQSTGGRGDPAVRLLLTDVPVLQAAASTGGGGLGAAQNPASQSSNVTLNVGDNAVGYLAYAAENGKVWLVLRPANAAAAKPSSAVTAQTLLQGSGPLATGGTK